MTDSLSFREPGSFGGHHLNKFCKTEQEETLDTHQIHKTSQTNDGGKTSLSRTFIVDLSVSVDICFSDHLVYLLVGQLLTQVGHHVTQLRCADVTVSVLVNTHSVTVSHSLTEMPNRGKRSSPLLSG